MYLDHQGLGTGRDGKVKLRLGRLTVGYSGTVAIGTKARERDERHWDLQRMKRAPSDPFWSRRVWGPQSSVHCFRYQPLGSRVRPVAPQSIGLHATRLLPRRFYAPVERACRHPILALHLGFDRSSRQRLL